MDIGFYQIASKSVSRVGPSACMDTWMDGWIKDRYYCQRLNHGVRIWIAVSRYSTLLCSALLCFAASEHSRHILGMARVPVVYYSIKLVVVVVVVVYHALFHDQRGGFYLWGFGDLGGVLLFVVCIQLCYS